MTEIVLAILLPLQIPSPFPTLGFGYHVKLWCRFHINPDLGVALSDRRHWTLRCPAQAMHGCTPTATALLPVDLVFVEVSWLSILLQDSPRVTRA